MATPIPAQANTAPINVNAISTRGWLGSTTPAQPTLGLQPAATALIRNRLSQFVDEGQLTVKREEAVIEAGRLIAYNIRQRIAGGVQWHSLDDLRISMMETEITLQMLNEKARPLLVSDIAIGDKIVMKRNLEHPYWAKCDKYGWPIKGPEAGPFTDEIIAAEGVVTDIRDGFVRIDGPPWLQVATAPSEMSPITYVERVK